MELKLGYLESDNRPLPLLIVPYGIETKFWLSAVVSANLLIVPYGIETAVCAISHLSVLTFNRTLWN